MAADPAATPERLSPRRSHPQVAIHNPSSFAFLPLGSVEMLIQSADLQPFARCTTVAPIGLPHGNSTIMLTGTINVGQSDANRLAFSGAQGMRVSGVSSHPSL